MMFLRSSAKCLIERYPFIRGKTFQVYGIYEVVQCAVRRPGELPGQTFQLTLKDLTLCTRVRFNRRS